MTGNVVSSLGRVRLTDLIASEGLPTDSYKFSVSALTQSLAQFSAAIIQLPPSDSAVLRCGLESARLFFNQNAYPPSEMMRTNEARDWCKTSGYYADPQLWQETYDYRPGLTATEPNDVLEFPPSGLPDIFAILGKASRDILDAISFSLNLRSCSFAGILDNFPLRSREISSSVLSLCCHSRPSFQGVENPNTTAQEDGQLIMYEHEHQVDKTLITLVKSDRAGLHIKDFHGRWLVVDEQLGPNDAIVYPGLALYQATAGYVSPAMYRTEVDNMQTNIYGRCSMVFKLMPRSMATLSCSEMRAAGYGVDAQFQSPIPVDDFMQRSHSTDQLLNKVSYPSYTVQGGQDASLKPMLKRKKSSARSKPLPPSKRLRLEAQRVLKERVQAIADKKNIKLRFCNLKECEGGHLLALDSPCANIRMEIGWPPGVPFVHPHDLPNKAKLGFLEAYDPGWAGSQQDMELSPVKPHDCCSKENLRSFLETIAVMLNIGR